MKWSEISPDAHPFDRETARARIGQIVRDIAIGPNEERSSVEKRLTDQFVREFGSWIRDWNWSTYEGGPVRYAHAELTPESVADWRDFTEELLACFRKIEKIKIESPGMKFCTSAR